MLSLECQLVDYVMLSNPFQTIRQPPQPPPHTMVVWLQCKIMLIPSTLDPWMTNLRT